MDKNKMGEWSWLIDIDIESEVQIIKRNSHDNFLQISHLKMSNYIYVDGLRELIVAHWLNWGCESWTDSMNNWPSLCLSSCLLMWKLFGLNWLEEHEATLQMGARPQYHFISSIRTTCMGYYLSILMINYWTLMNSILPLCCRRLSSPINLPLIFASLSIFSICILVMLYHPLIHLLLLLLLFLLLLFLPIFPIHFIIFY